MGAVPSQIESLYSEKFRSLVGFARRRLPGQIDPEDVVQASFLKLLERADIDTLDVPASYLMAVVKNEVVAQLRAESSMERNVDRAASLPTAVEHDPTDAVEEEEIARVAAAATSSLPTRQKRILAKYLAGMTPSEIADSESTASRRVHANQISSLLTRTSRKLHRTMATRGLLSAGPIVQLRRRFRGYLIKIQQFDRLAEAQTFVIACVITASQLAATVGASTPSDGLLAPGGSATAARSAGNVMITEGMKTTKTVGRASAKSVRRDVASLQLVMRRADLQSRDEHDADHPGTIDQLIQLIQDPSKVPLPECGGILVCP
jgi:RNA polymerase sigma factor (sigma-70 family)